MSGVARPESGAPGFPARSALARHPGSFAALSGDRRRAFRPRLLRAELVRGDEHRLGLPLLFLLRFFHEEEAERPPDERLAEGNAAAAFRARGERERRRVERAAFVL